MAGATAMSSFPLFNNALDSKNAYSSLQRSQIPPSSSAHNSPPRNYKPYFSQYGSPYQTSNLQHLQQRPPRSLRIECTGRVIHWSIEDELTFARLQNYIQSAFFIENQQFSIRSRSAKYNENTDSRHITNDDTLQEALRADPDLIFDILIHTVEEENARGSSYPDWHRPSRMDSVVMDYSGAAGTGRYSSSRLSALSPNVSPPPTPPASSISSSADALQRRKSTIYIPPPLKRQSSARISGVTQTIRQKLQFADEGQWKKFSARRLELIDSMALSSRKASEQDDVIIAVADTLREEYGFPPHTLPDFDKLVRAAVQSVRRNRKRLPKYKSRSKSLSADAESSEERGPLTPPIAAINGMAVSNEHSPDLAKTGSAPYGISYFNFGGASLQSRRSESSAATVQEGIPIVQSSHLQPVMSPIGSSVSSSSRHSVSSASSLSSILSPDESREYYMASLGPSARQLAPSPHPPVSPAPLTSPPLETAYKAQIVLELVYSGRATQCAISVADLLSNADAPVALYYFRAGDGSRVQISSDAEANLAMRAAQTATGVPGVRVEVITMNEIMALHQQQSRTGQSGNAPAQAASSANSLDASRRISIGALVGV